MPLRKRHLPVILQMEPLDTAPDQIFPAWLHGRTQETGIQGCYFTYNNKSQIIKLLILKLKYSATLLRTNHISGVYLWPGYI